MSSSAGVDFERSFEYENAYALTAPVNRISKFVTHLDLFRQIAEVPGEIVECGVFRANSFMRWIKFRSLLGNAHSKKVIGFDSFGPFPESKQEIDFARRQEFIDETGGGQSITTEQLTAALDKLKLNQNVELIAGDILQTVPAYLSKYSHLRISLLNIDVDLYEPTRVALESFYPHVSRGGIVILDDYGAMPGANKAIDEFFKGTGIKVEKLPFSHAISFIRKP